METVNKPRICVLGIYFGKLRPDFPLWLKSCGWNRDIDFLLVTDADTSIYDFPPNVHIHRSSLPEVRDRISQILGYPVSLERPYKLCDYKPLFGLIFKELTSDYKYWGHCDFDMMYGRISHFTRLYDIEKYVRFLCQGHLSFYRNTPRLAEYIYLPGAAVEARTVFTTDRGYAFDETNGIGSIFRKNNIPQFERNIYADISPNWFRMRRSPLYPWDKTPADPRLQIFMWERGRAYWVYVDGKGKVVREEMLYIHYQKRPLRYDLPSLLKADCILFTPTEILPWEGELTPKDIKRLNPPRPLRDLYDIAKFKGSYQYRRVLMKIKKELGIRN